MPDCLTMRMQLFLLLSLTLHRFKLVALQQLEEMKHQAIKLNLPVLIKIKLLFRIILKQTRLQRYPGLKQCNI